MGSQLEKITTGKPVLPTAPETQITKSFRIYDVLHPKKAIKKLIKEVFNKLK